MKERCPLCLSFTGQSGVKYSLNHDGVESGRTRGAHLPIYPCHGMVTINYNITNGNKQKAISSSEKGEGRTECFMHAQLALLS